MRDIHHRLRAEGSSVCRGEERPSGFTEFFNDFNDILFRYIGNGGHLVKTSWPSNSKVLAPFFGDGLEHDLTNALLLVVQFIVGFVSMLRQGFRHRADSFIML